MALPLGTQMLYLYVWLPRRPLLKPYSRFSQGSPSRLKSWQTMVPILSLDLWRKFMFLVLTIKTSLLTDLNPMGVWNASTTPRCKWWENAWTTRLTGMSTYRTSYLRAGKLLPQRPVTLPSNCLANMLMVPLIFFDNSGSLLQRHPETLQNGSTTSERCSTPWGRWQPTDRDESKGIQQGSPWQERHWKVFFKRWPCSSFFSCSGW